MSQRLIATIALLAIAAALFVGLSNTARSEPESQRAAPAEQAERAESIAPPEEAVDDRVSYALGYDIGHTFRSRGIEVDMSELIAGLRAGLGEREARMDEQQVQQVLTEFSLQMQQRQQQQHQAEAAAQRERGERFLEQNREAEGVMETPSGLQYQVIEPGEGASPAPTDTVLVHYTGRFIDGEVFDSSRERGQPVQFPLNQVIPGWTEGMQLMQEGGRYKLFIPPELAYGERGRGDAMPPNATLIFDVELLEVHPADE